jgi:isopentenyl diphosphate isomerase/L-lactate dehydrogenase-like FMN-dependent dehydrogenase
MVASRAGKRFRRSLVGVAAIGSHPQKPALVSIAKGRIPIAVDGGIRRGSDIFKALALGAKFCFIGRIPFWGLAVSSS